MALLSGPCAFAADQTEASIDGVWAVSGTWQGDGTFNETWTFDQRGPRFSGTTSQPLPFSGITLGPIVKLTIEGGCVPVYTSFNATSSSMSGKMKCSDGSGGRGTWQGTKNIAGVEEEAPEGGASSSCPEQCE